MPLSSFSTAASTNVLNTALLPLLSYTGSVLPRMKYDAAKPTPNVGLDAVLLRTETVNDACPRASCTQPRATSSTTKLFFAVDIGNFLGEVGLFCCLQNLQRQGLCVCVVVCVCVCECVLKRCSCGHSKEHKKQAQALVGRKAEKHNFFFFRFDRWRHTFEFCACMHVGKIKIENLRQNSDYDESEVSYFKLKN